MPLRDRVRHILPGEPVSAAVAGRPDRDNEQNIRILSDRMDAAELGSAVRLYDQPLDTACLVGMAVYWNAASNVWSPGLAAVQTDTAVSAVVPAPTAFVRGIVSAKATANAGDILLLGADQVDISAAVHGPVVPGQYYLSASTPGFLVQQPARVTVPVVAVLGNGLVVANPVTRDAFEDHVHYRFRLHAKPAGGVIAPAPGAIHTIATPDSTQPGWLPASDPSFAGKAPFGAVFGYNLPAHPELAAVWPPIPLAGCALFWDKAQNHVGGTLVPAGGGGLVEFTRDGIWWMSNCYGDVPWPVDYVSEVSLTASSPPECPRAEEMELVLAFTNMTFKTDAATVTSLQAGPTGTVRITDCYGNPASSGPLMIDVPLNFQITDPASLAGVAVKSLAGRQMTMGPVAATIEAGSNVQVTSTSPLTIGGRTLHSGQVKISFNYAGDSVEIEPEVLRLSSTEERFRLGVPYFAFPVGRQSQLALKFHVPLASADWLTTLFAGGGKFRLKFWVTGTTAGTLPNLTVSSIDIQDPGSGVGSLASTSTAVPCTFAAAIQADQFVSVTSSPILVSPGDMVVVTVTRASSDSYAGEVGFLKAFATLSAS